MDEQDRTPDLNTPDTDDERPVDENLDGEGVPIPTRLRDAVEGIGRRAKEEFGIGQQEHDIVDEYEERYHGRAIRLETPSEKKMPPQANLRIPHKPKRRSYAVNVDKNERKWAALAHASTLLTALVGLASGGAGVLLTLFIPLFIYFSFRNRSQYVAFHALQAFAIQLIGTVGFLALLIVGFVVWVALVIVSALLIIVLVGLILLPIAVMLLPLFVLASLILPVGMVIYSVIATVETWNGRHYRYPYIARWVESQMQDD